MRPWAAGFSSVLPHYAAIQLLPIILRVITVPGLVSFSSRLIILVEAALVEEVGLLEAGSSGKVAVVSQSQVYGVVGRRVYGVVGHRGIVS